MQGPGVKQLVREPETDVLIERLVESARLGEVNEDDFRQLFARYRSQVERLLPRRFVGPEERRELIQEVFFAVHKGMERCPKDAFEPWLTQITRNTLINWQAKKYAKKRNAQELSLDDLPSADRFAMTDASALAAVIDEERQRELYRAMAELPPQMRRCVLLRVVRDLRIREIAEVLQVSDGTVKTHISQAKKRLRQLLGEHFQIEF